MAARKKKTMPQRKNPALEKLQAGILLHRQSPLFGRLGGWITQGNHRNMGKECAALVRQDGTIYLNADYLSTPKQWAYRIAHCQLHLAFGHFDAEKMPGYHQKGSFDKKRWNMACDIYIAKFLADVKYGEPFCPDPAGLFPGSLTEEQKIYDFLSEQGDLQASYHYGTGVKGAFDMIGLDKPIVYEEKARNQFAVRFAYALAESVSGAVSEAGGYGENAWKDNTASAKAAQWFISHYPLLGGLAASFRIIEDYRVCIREEIQIAAIDVTQGMIYVNPAAGLSDGELKFVLAHEYLHAGLQHHERCQGRDRYLWNVACDYVINGWLREMGIGEMLLEGLLYDEAMKGMSAESIYDMIVRDLKKYSRLDTLRGYGKGDVLDRPCAGLPSSAGNMPPGVPLDEFYRNALAQGLEYEEAHGRGRLPAGLVQEIRALAVPPVPWEVELAKWFDCHFTPAEKKRTYARPSRRQGATPDIPRPRYVEDEALRNGRIFGVVVDTSGSMSVRLIGMALGAIASYAAAKDVPLVRVVFCDAQAYDAGYLAPEEIAGRVEVKGRGGTILQPGVNLLERAEDFPKDGPILIITDGDVEDRMSIRREHAFLVPKGKRLPFRAKGEVFYFKE